MPEQQKELESFKPFGFEVFFLSLLESELERPADPSLDVVPSPNMPY